MYEVRSNLSFLVRGPRKRIRMIGCGTSRDVTGLKDNGGNRPQTTDREERLNCWAMKHFSQVGRVVTIALALLGLAALPTLAQGKQDNRTALKPDAPGLAHNHRLILKDGSYQIVR